MQFIISREKEQCNLLKQDNKTTTIKSALILFEFVLKLKKTTTYTSKTLLSLKESFYEITFVNPPSVRIKMRHNNFDEVVTVHI